MPPARLSSLRAPTTMHAYAGSAKTIPTTITALHIFTPPSSISHLQKQNRFASEDGFYFTATFDTTPLTVRASYTVGTGWYHHGNLTPRQDLCRPPPLLAAKAGRKYHYPLSMSLRRTPPQGAFSGLYSLDTIFCGFSGYQRPPWLSSRIPFALAGLVLPLVTAGRECSV